MQYSHSRILSFSNEALTRPLGFWIGSCDAMLALVELALARSSALGIQWDWQGPSWDKILSKWGYRRRRLRSLIMGQVGACTTH
jgi:hypothetical protein